MLSFDRNAVIDRPMRFLGKKWLAAGILSILSSSALAAVDITIHAPVITIDDQQQAAENLKDVPGNTALIDDRNWQNQRAETVKDITDYTPGVFAQPRDGAESARLSVRGSGLANTFQGRGLLVEQDGIPITMADGEFEFPVIDPWLIKYAEVLPGANALSEGASNFGGTINLITPTGVTGHGNELRGEGGSFGTSHGMLATGQQWAGGDLYAAASGYTQDGFRDQNSQTTSRLNANWGWQGNSNFTDRVYLSHTQADAEVPGAISLAQIAANPSQANPLNFAGDYARNLDITRIADKSAWVNGADRLETVIFYTYRTLDNPVTTYEFQRNNDLGVRAKYTHRYGLNHWLAGVNSYYGNAGETRFQNIGGRPGAHILDRDLSATTSELYAQIEQNLFGRFYGIAGAQGSYATRDIDQTFPNATQQNKNYSGFSPQLGLRYDITREKQIFANLSRSFEAPTFSELSGGNNPGFRQLAAQRATTVEIGTRGIIDHLHWSAAYYHGWLHNEFVNYRFQNGDTATINADHSKRDGIELGLNGNLLQNLWADKDAVELRAAYTYSHFRLDGDPLYGNNILPGVPENYLRAELLYHHPSGISLGPNIEFAPTSAPIDLTNSLYANGYTILGARAFWDAPNSQGNFYIEGRNLFNQNYIATYNVVPNAAGQDGQYFYPGEGRAIYAGFQWQL